MLAVIAESTIKALLAPRLQLTWVKGPPKAKGWNTAGPLQELQEQVQESGKKEQEDLNS